MRARHDARMVEDDAWMRKVKLRGLAKVDWLLVFASAAGMPRVTVTVSRWIDSE